MRALVSPGSTITCIKSQAAKRRALLAGVSPGRAEGSIVIWAPVGAAPTVGAIVRAIRAKDSDNSRLSSAHFSKSPLASIQVSINCLSSLRKMKAAFSYAEKSATCWGARSRAFPRFGWGWLGVCSSDLIGVDPGVDQLLEFFAEDESGFFVCGKISNVLGGTLAGFPEVRAKEASQHW